MQRAVAPKYLKGRYKVEIDLTKIPDISDESFWKTASQIIKRKVDNIYDDVQIHHETTHISVFAIAPIPLLIYLGSKLSDKLDVDLYQRHRNPETWSWKEQESDVSYVWNMIVNGEKNESAILLINLSGRNDINTIPKNIKENKCIYELTLGNKTPNPLFLNTRLDLQHFTTAYINCLSEIHKNHSNIKNIHLFPAVPAPIAITIGRSRLPKVGASLTVYDYDKRAEGFIETLIIE